MFQQQVVRLLPILGEKHVVILPQDALEEGPVLRIAIGKQDGLHSRRENRALLARRPVVGAHVRIAQHQVVYVTAVDIGNQAPPHEYIDPVSRIRHFAWRHVGHFLPFAQRIVHRILGIVRGVFHFLLARKTEAPELFLVLPVRKQELEHPVFVGHYRHGRFHQIVEGTQFRENTAHFPILGHYPRRFHVLHGIGKGLRLAIVVALRLLAADFLQEIHLLLRLDTLCQRFQAKTLRHAHHRTDNDAGNFVQVREERHVNLELVELVVLEGIQRRISAPEIVHPDLETRQAEALDFALHVRVRRHDALGDFDTDEFVANPEPPERPFDHLEDVAAGKIQARKVERHGDHRAAVFQFVAQFPADKLYDVAVELVDLAGILERADEHSRIQESVQRVYPAGKRLHAAERFRNRADDRLVVNLDIAVRDRLVDMAHHVVLQQQVLVQAIVVIADKLVALLLLEAAGEFRLFARFQEFIEFLYPADSDIEVHRYLRHNPLDALADFGQLFLDAVDVRDYREVVVRETADQVIPELFPEAIRKVHQEFVAPAEPVRAIVEFHPHDIDKRKDRGASRLPDIVDVVLAAQAGVFHIRKPRQGIEVAIGMLAHAQEYGALALPRNLGYVQYQVFPGTRAPDNRLAPF